MGSVDSLRSARNVSWEILTIMPGEFLWDTGAQEGILRRHHLEQWFAGAQWAGDHLQQGGIRPTKWHRRYHAVKWSRTRSGGSRKVQRSCAFPRG